MDLRIYLAAFTSLNFFSFLPPPSHLLLTSSSLLTTFLCSLDLHHATTPPPCSSCITLPGYRSTLLSPSSPFSLISLLPHLSPPCILAFIPPPSSYLDLKCIVYFLFLCVCRVTEVRVLVGQSHPKALCPHTMCVFVLC